MRVIVLEKTRGVVYPMDIDNDLKSMQEIVGGYIECAPVPQLNEMGIALVVNEEGVLLGLPINENLLPFFFAGPVFMVGVKGDEFVSLTGEQLIFIRDWLQRMG